MTSLSLLLLCAGPVAASAPVVGGGPAPLEDGSWHLSELDLEVTAFPYASSMVVEGRMTIELRNGSSAGPDLAVGSELRFRDVSLLGGATGSPTIESNVSAGAQGVRAQLRFDEPLPAGTRLEIGFACESVAEANQLQVDDDVAFASWVQGWYPFAVDASRSFSSQMSAVGTTTFRLPPGWDAVSNGRRGSLESDDEEVVVTWTVDVPVARSFSAAAYRSVFHEVGERPIGVFLLEGTTLDGERQAELLAAALAAQEERFGPYPYSSYAIAEVPPGSGGFYASSEQGFIMARSGAFVWDHGNLPLWGHEMAHGWWGNLVGTTGPGGILCSESLAQYSAVVAIEAIEGREAATEFLRFSRSGYSDRQCARGYFDMARRGNDMPLSELGSGGWMHDLSDAKGHWVYHMLRRRIGDELFFQGLRELIERYSERPMSLDDLRRHFAAIAPEAGLELFFEQWLDRPGAPVLEATWSRPAEGSLELVVRQVQDGEPYVLDVDVAWGEEGEVRRETVRIEARETRVPMKGASGLEPIELDPDHALLIWTPEYGSRP